MGTMKSMDGAVMTTDLTSEEETIEVVWSFLPDKELGCNPWFGGAAWSPVGSNKFYEKVWMGEYKDCDDK